MAWTIDWLDEAKKDFACLGRADQRRIARYLHERIAEENPLTQGKPLSGRLAGLWRYRVGEYSIICRIKDGKITVVVVAVGHRSVVYDSH